MWNNTTHHLECCLLESTCWLAYLFFPPAHSCLPFKSICSSYSMHSAYKFCMHVCNCWNVFDLFAIRRERVGPYVCDSLSRFLGMTGRGREFCISCDRNTVEKTSFPTHVHHDPPSRFTMGMCNTVKDVIAARFSGPTPSANILCTSRMNTRAWLIIFYYLHGHQQDTFMYRCL